MKPTTTFKPNTGLVLVKLPPAVDSIKTQSGLKLAIDTSWDVEKYQPVYGDVLALPDFYKKNGKLTAINIKVGDRVYFPYLTMLNARKCNSEGMSFEDGEGATKELYAVIPYDVLIFAIWYLPVEGSEPVEQIQMLNDYVLAEAKLLDQEIEHIQGYGNAIIDTTYKSESGLILVAADESIGDTYGKKKTQTHSDEFCIITHAASDSGLCEGDEVLYDTDSDLPLEFDLIQSMKKKYFRMKVSDLLCKMVDGEPEPINDNVIVLPDPQPYKGKLFIPDNQRKREKGKTGTVVKVGPKVDNIKIGEKWVYGASPFNKNILIDFEKHEIVKEELFLCQIN